MTGGGGRAQMTFYTKFFATHSLRDGKNIFDAPPPLLNPTHLNNWWADFPKNLCKWWYWSKTCRIWSLGDSASCKVIFSSMWNLKRTKSAKHHFNIISCTDFMENQDQLLRSFEMTHSPAAHGGRLLPMGWIYWPKCMLYMEGDLLPCQIWRP